MDVEQVIDQLGGRHAMQALLGVGPSAISNYIARGCFPRRVQAIIEAALQNPPEHFSPDNRGITPASSTVIHPTHGTRIALIIGGGIANVFDRIVFGSVTDFLYIKLTDLLRTGIFNIADLAVTTGMIILVVGSFRKKKTVAK